jgi:hypothetical protein
MSAGMAAKVGSAIEIRQWVYDSHLLWRANLYIDEGFNDWNNKNPWNDSANNDWFVSKANGAPVDGGQGYQIKPFTLHMHQPDNTYIDYFVSQNVAYYHWGIDSPAEFNNKIGQQKNILGQWYPNEGVTYKFNRPVCQWGSKATIANKTLNDLFALTFDQEEWNQLLGDNFKNANADQKKTQVLGHMNVWFDGSSVYTQTTAPNAKWPNYIGDLLGTNPYQLGGVSSYPYRPGDPISDGDQNERGKYIGVDCLGFVWRSASYRGNSYHWASTDEQAMVIWSAKGYRSFGWPDQDAANVTLVARSNAITFPKNINPIIPEMKRVIPGDVVIFHKIDGNYRHFAMVQDVRPNEDGSVSLSGVVLIESSYRNEPLITGTTMTQAMSFYENLRYQPDPYGAWEIYRLKPR